MAENITNTENAEDNPALEPTPEDLTRYQIGLATTAQLVERSRQADSLLADFASRAKAAEDALERRLDLERRQLDAVSKTFTSEQLQQARQQAEATARREIKEKTDDRRWSVLRSLAAIEQQMGVIEEMFSSPAHILARHNLGTEERSRYLEQVRTAGPVAIGNYAKHAAATGDKTLGAVIMDRLDDMSPNDRKAAKVGVPRQDGSLRHLECFFWVDIKYMRQHPVRI